MTKNAEFQKELKEKVRAGVKPSQLKKLKRSKSAGDIPSTPLSPATKIKELEDKVSVLELRIETKDREIVEKDAEIKELKRNLPLLLTEPIDQYLMARHRNLKDWFVQYSQNRVLEKELAENLTEASNELIEQDNLIANLRTQNSKLQLEKTSLQKDLQLATKLAELRSNWPQPKKESSTPYLLYALVAVGFISLLNSQWKVKRKYE